MTDKLTFSFNGPVKVRIGGQDIDLGAKSDSLTYAGRNKDGPLAGFKADDGTFFRLKDKGGGRVDVVVYGEPEKLARYQFKVRSGDLTKARFADGGDFRRTPESARNFTLDGKALTGSQRDAFLRDNAFVAKDLPPKQASQPSNTPAVTPGGPPVSSVPARSAPSFALPALAKGLQSYDELEQLLSHYRDSTQGASQQERKLIDQILDNLRAERRANENRQADQRKEQVSQTHIQADKLQDDIDQDDDEINRNTNPPMFEAKQIDAPDRNKALSPEDLLLKKLDQMAKTDSELFTVLKAEYQSAEPDVEGLPSFALAQSMIGKHGGADKALKQIEEQESLRARSAAAEIAQQEGQTDAIAKKLQTLKLKPANIPDDGHCLYAALAHAAGIGSANNDLQPVMALRERLLKRALSLTDDQQIALTSKSDGSPVSAQSTVSFLTTAVKEIIRGLNVREPNQEGWGTFHSLHLAAIELQRPIIAISYDDQATLYRPDGSREALQANWVELARPTSADGAGPLIIPQASATHWVSTERLS